MNAHHERYCQRCSTRLGRDQTDRRCSPCRRAAVDQAAVTPPVVPADFWQYSGLRQALDERHIGRVFHEYRHAHTPVIKQVELGEWLGLTQSRISRIEADPKPVTDLAKLDVWARIMRIPPALLWFSSPHASQTLGASALPPRMVSVDGNEQGERSTVDRRDALKALTGLGIAAAGSGLLGESPWQRLADTLGGHRAADAATVTLIENRTAEFFRAEETVPARQLLLSLRQHRQAVGSLAMTTSNDELKHRLMAAAGETDALTGWLLFDMQQHREAVDVWRGAVQTAREIGDGPLVACLLGYWSYLLSARGNGTSSCKMLVDAAGYVRGSAAATSSWIAARQAEESAALGESTTALRALDRAVNVFDYANPRTERSWTTFFSASRLGSLAVSTYSRLDHSDTDAMATSLLGSLTPTENKVRALVLADLATSAARHRNYDRAEELANVAAPLAVRTEASLATDRLWEMIELLPKQGNGNAVALREQVTEQLFSGAGSRQ